LEAVKFDDMQRGVDIARKSQDPDVQQTKNLFLQRRKKKL
jgi:hypothetical protein